LVVNRLESSITLYYVDLVTQQFPKYFVKFYNGIYFVKELDVLPEFILCENFVLEIELIFLKTWMTLTNLSWNNLDWCFDLEYV